MILVARSGNDGVQLCSVKQLWSSSITARSCATRQPQEALQDKATFVLLPHGKGAGRVMSLLASVPTILQVQKWEPPLLLKVATNPIPHSAPPSVQFHSPTPSEMHATPAISTVIAHRCSIAAARYTGPVLRQLWQWWLTIAAGGALQHFLRWQHCSGHKMQCTHKNYSNPWFY